MEVNRDRIQYLFDEREAQEPVSSILPIFSSNTELLQYLIPPNSLSTRIPTDNTSLYENLYTRKSTENKIIIENIFKKSNPEILNARDWSITIFESRDRRIIPEHSTREINTRNERIDSFIIDSLQRIREQENQLSRFDVLVTTGDSLPSAEAASFHSSSGLTAVAYRKTPRFFGEITIDGERVVIEDNRYARIDFMPGGRSSKDETRVTDSLAKGILGIKELITAIDTGEVDLPGVFIGNTNLNMALIAERLGFRIVDQDRTTDGEPDMKKGTYTVVGKVEDIGQKLHEFEQTGRANRLLARHQRYTERERNASPQLTLNPAAA